MKSMRQIGRLEVQIRIHIADFEPKTLQCRPTGWKLRQGFYLQS